MEFFKALPEYDGGNTVNCIYNCGCGMQDDQTGKEVENNYMILVTDTSENEYKAYIDKLINQGYRGVFQNRIEDNLYTQLSGSYLLYIYYTAQSRETRIILDNCSMPSPEFGYETEVSSYPVTVVQYGLYYDKNNGHSPTTTNCGMLYMVRLADNSLFMIDGGDILQCSDESAHGMLDFMHRLTETAPGEQIRIAAWFITHAHNDHFCGAAKLINRFHDQLCVERFVYNFPSSAVRGPDDKLPIFKGIVNNYCPKAKYLKAHTGQSFDLGGVRFDIMYTFEDSIRADSPSAYPLRDYNCTSTIVKMTVGDNSVMWLGDTNVEAENIITSVWSPSVWKSDVVQVAHHCFNYLSNLYPWIDADYAMLPNSYFGGHTPENTPKLQEVLDRLSASNNIWYSDRTTGFVFENGEYRQIIDEDRVGGEYDFSGF